MVGTATTSLQPVGWQPPLVCSNCYSAVTTILQASAYGNRHRRMLPELLPAPLAINNAPGEPIAQVGPAVSRLVLFTFQRNICSPVAAQSPASTAYATGPGVLNLWLPGVLRRRLFNLPLNTGAKGQHPGRRRHPVMPQGQAYSTCCRRGSGAGAL